ncbi:MAG: beta-propeller fold lactonase family protein [Leptospira sp.]|nr:beta-propeller fold lactonase family protein [Leptospira sp.]
MFKRISFLILLIGMQITTSACLVNPFVQRLFWLENSKSNINPLFALLFLNEKRIQLDKNFLGVKRGTKEKLNGTIFVWGAPSSSGIEWSSANQSVATVDGSGLVTGVSNGKTVIQAKIPGENISVSCPVTVFSGYLYASLDDANEVTIASFNHLTGEVTWLNTQPTGISPTGIATDPFGRYLYTGNFDSNTISQFSINSNNGSLSLLGAAVNTGSNPRNIAISIDSKFLYIANETANIVSQYSIGSNGTLTPVTTYATLPVTFVSIDPTGKYLLTIGPTVTQLSSYSIDPTSGILTQKGTSPSFDSQALFSFHPNGRYVFVGSSPNLRVLELNRESGALSTVADTNHSAVPHSSAIHPNGKFVYFVNSSVGTISCFVVDPSTGILQNASTVATGFSDIRFMVIDPTGNFAFVANKTGNLIRLRVDQDTGKLDDLSVTNVGGTQWNLVLM